jgi:hypothetical protein
MGQVPQAVILKISAIQGAFYFHPSNNLPKILRLDYTA